jgi:hypothetical protein
MVESEIWERLASRLAYIIQEHLTVGMSDDSIARFLQFGVARGGSNFFEEAFSLRLPIAWELLYKVHKRAFFAVARFLVPSGRVQDASQSQDKGI